MPLNVSVQHGNASLPPSDARWEGGKLLGSTPVSFGLGEFLHSFIVGNRSGCHCCVQSSAVSSSHTLCPSTAATHTSKKRTNNQGHSLMDISSSDSWQVIKLLCSQALMFGSIYSYRFYTTADIFLNRYFSLHLKKKSLSEEPSFSFISIQTTTWKRLQIPKQTCPGQ